MFPSTCSWSPMPWNRYTTKNTTMLRLMAQNRDKVIMRNRFFWGSFTSVTSLFLFGIIISVPRKCGVNKM